MRAPVKKSSPSPLERRTAPAKPLRAVDKKTLLATASLVAAAAALLACGASQPQSATGNPGCNRPGQIDPNANPQPVAGGMMAPVLPIQPSANPPPLPGEPALPVTPASSAQPGATVAR